MTPQPINRSPRRRASVLIGLLLVLPAMASAHAFLDRAEPKVGSEIAKSPADVRIKFTQNIEPAFSAIQVFDASGKQVDKKDSHLDSNEKSTLIVSVEQLPPGEYKVSWHVVSVDTHRTHGDFKFTVKS